MTDDLCFMTIAEAAHLIERRELSPVELTEAFLRRIEVVNPKIHAFVTVTKDRALEDAKRAEREIRSGLYRGRLHGIPIALKDIYDTDGILTTAHSKLHANRVPNKDAKAAEHLRSAGTVLLGKLATHEFAFAGPAWDLPFPPARNPWNIDHFTGGSSSGSGAAIAAGLAMAALGTDTAGSIRMPAYYCGVTGFKPTYGRVSRRGVIPLSYTMDHCGPLTWNAHDNAIVLQAIAGYDPDDPGSVNVQVPDYLSSLGGNLEGMKVGLIRHFYDGDENADNDVKVAMASSVETLQSLGALVQDVSLSSIHDYSACCQIIIMCEALGIHEKDFKESPDKYSEIASDRLMLSSVLTGADYVQATRLRRQLSVEVERALKKFDVLITAGGLGPAPRIDEVSKFYILQKPLLTTPFDVTGSPSIGVCNGFSSTGLPLGMQITGKSFDEATVLRVADAFERATSWRERRPNI